MVGHELKIIMILVILVVIKLVLTGDGDGDPDPVQVSPDVVLLLESLPRPAFCCHPSQ